MHRASRAFLAGPWSFGSLTTELTEKPESIQRKQNELSVWSQGAKADQRENDSFSFHTVQERPTFPSWKKAEVKNHLLQFLKLTGSVALSNQLPVILSVVDLQGKTPGPAEEQNNHHFKTARRASLLLPLKKKKITMIDNKETVLVISRQSARTRHVFQIMQQHCTTKKYAEVFHLK